MEAIFKKSLVEDYNTLDCSFFNMDQAFICSYYPASGKDSCLFV